MLSSDSTSEDEPTDAAEEHGKVKVKSNDDRGAKAKWRASKPVKEENTSCICFVARGTSWGGDHEDGGSAGHQCGSCVVGQGHCCSVNGKIVLPRIIDVIKGIQDLWRHRGEAVDNPEFQVEMIVCDLSDAYCHFGVASRELGQCLAPHPDGQNVILFKAMLFGFKAAPLIMGRLLAAMTRMWQALLVDHQGVMSSQRCSCLQVSEVTAHCLPGRLNDMADWLARPDPRGE